MSCATYLHMVCNIYLYTYIVNSFKWCLQDLLVASMWCAPQWKFHYINYYTENIIWNEFSYAYIQQNWKLEPVIRSCFTILCKMCSYVSWYKNTLGAKKEWQSKVESSHKSDWWQQGLISDSSQGTTYTYVLYSV